MTLPLIEVSGSAYQQGLQHGEQLQTRIEHNVAVYFDRFLREGKVERAEVLRRAALYADAIAGHNPKYEAGMRGIADGAGLPYEEIVALNVRYEILYYQYAVNQMAAHDGCTAFALSPEITANGHLIVGQNWDWIPEVQGALLHSIETDGLHSLAFTEAGIFGGKIGMNSAGMGLVINGITTTADDWSRLGKPFHLRCYEILRQRSLQEAVQLVTESEGACSANFLIAQWPHQAINVEAAPDSANAIAWQEGCLVHTNHFVDPGSIGVVEPPDELRIFSCKREERMAALLRQKQPVVKSDILRYLKDHTNAPRSICRHEEPGAPIDERYRTVTSIVMDLDERLMLVSDGPPCENAYERISFQTTPI